MKKKFELHLDALLVIVFLFVLSLGVNYVQYSIYADLVKENAKLQMDALVDQFNLDAKDKRIGQLEAEQTTAEN